MSSPLVLCSPAESLGHRGCHVFCSPRSIPLTHSKFHCTRKTGFRSFFHFGSRIHSPQQPCSSTMLQNTTVLPYAQNKSLASPLCILHRSPVVPAAAGPFLPSTLAQLAVGSQHSSRSSFHLLHSFRKPPAVRRATLLHRQRSRLFDLLCTKIKLS